MARVTQQRNGKQASGSGFIKGGNQPGQRKRQKVVLENDGNGKDKGRSVLSFTVNPPHGYTFIPAGNPQLTNALKEFARKGNHKVMSVSTTPHAARHELSRVVHRVGYHFPTVVVAEVCAYYGIRLDSRGRVIKDKGQKDDIFSMRLFQNGELVLDEKVRDQVDINTEAKETITDLFPTIPDKDMFQIIKTAFQLGDGKVGTAEEIPLVRRAQLSVVAHIRHVYTEYDKLIRRIPYNEARHAVEKDTLKKLVEWSGDASAQDEGKQRQAEDIFREVIVLSDDEASDSDGDDADQIVHNDLRVEELPSNAYAPAPLRPHSPHAGYAHEEVVNGYRIVEAPIHHYTAVREVDLAAQDRNRYARWEQARQQYRPIAQAAPAVLERVYERGPERQLISLDPSVGRLVQSSYTRPADGRQMDTFQVPLSRPLSPPRYERLPPSQSRYGRIIEQPGYATPPTRTFLRPQSPASSSNPYSRPRTPPSRLVRLHQRTPSLNESDGTILPSIEMPQDEYPTHSGRRDNVGRRLPPPAAQRPDIIDLSSSVEQPPRRKQIPDTEPIRPNPFDRQNHRPLYDDRERSPRRSPVPVYRRIIEVDAPSDAPSTYLSQPGRQYREIREVDPPPTRRILMSDDDHLPRQRPNPFESATAAYTRVLRPISPEPPVIRRIVYADGPRPVIESHEPIRLSDDYPAVRRRELAPEMLPSSSHRDQDPYHRPPPPPIERRVVYDVAPATTRTDSRYDRVPDSSYARH